MLFRDENRKRQKKINKKDERKRRVDNRRLNDLNEKLLEVISTPPLARSPTRLTLFQGYSNRILTTSDHAMVSRPLAKLRKLHPREFRHEAPRNNESPSESEFRDGNWKRRADIVAARTGSSKSATMHLQLPGATLRSLRVTWRPE